MVENNKPNIRVHFNPGKRIQQVGGKTRHISFREYPKNTSQGLIKRPK